jgi:hypothetical protein
VHGIRYLSSRAGNRDIGTNQIDFDWESGAVLVGTATYQGKTTDAVKIEPPRNAEVRTFDIGGWSIRVLDRDGQYYINTGNSLIGRADDGTAIMVPRCWGSDIGVPFSLPAVQTNIFYICTGLLGALAALVERHKVDVTVLREEGTEVGEIGSLKLLSDRDLRVHHEMCLIFTRFGREVECGGYSIDVQIQNVDRLTYVRPVIRRAFTNDQKSHHHACATQGLQADSCADVYRSATNALSRSWADLRHPPGKVEGSPRVVQELPRYTSMTITRDSA